MKRLEAIQIIREELKNLINLNNEYTVDCDSGLILFEKLESLGLIKPPMSGDLKSQIAASHNKWDDE